MAYVLFRSMSFNFNVWGFVAIFLLLICSLIPLWSENILFMISIPLNLLRWFLWSRVWSVLMNAPYELIRVCILLIFYEVFYKCQFYQLIDGTIHLSHILMIFCLLALLSTDRGVLKFPTIIVNCYVFLENWPFYHYELSFFMELIFCWEK